MSSVKDTTVRGRRMWLALDVFLIVAASGSSSWALWAVPARPQVDQPRRLLIESQTSGADVTIKIDSRNDVHLGGERLDSNARLASVLAENPPRRVLLLIHTDALLQTVVRTIDQLEQAGVASVQLGTSG